VVMVGTLFAENLRAALADNEDIPNAETHTSSTESGAGAAEDSTYGTSNEPFMDMDTVPSLASAIAEVRATPPMDPIWKSDMDAVIQDLVRIQSECDESVKADLALALRRLKNVLASDHFLSPRRCNAFGSEEGGSILEHVEGHVPSVNPHHQRPSFERLHCRSMVDDSAMAAADNGGGAVAADLSISEESAKMVEMVEPSTAHEVSQSASSLGVPTQDGSDVQIGLPLWQRELNATKPSDELLSSWDFDPYAYCRVSPDEFGSDLWGDTAVTGVGLAMQMLSFHNIFVELKLDKAAMKRYLFSIERAYPRNPCVTRFRFNVPVVPFLAALLTLECLASISAAQISQSSSRFRCDADLSFGVGELARLAGST
jgi:hypothetical protein